MYMYMNIVLNCIINMYVHGNILKVLNSNYFVNLQ